MLEELLKTAIKVAERFDELEWLLVAPEVMNDNKYWRKLEREHAFLSENTILLVRDFIITMDFDTEQAEVLAPEIQKVLEEYQNRGKDIEVDNPEDLFVFGKKDLRIDTFRSGGAGGQHVNRTESAVRITHLATGIVATCQDERSQHRNKEKALETLKHRVREFIDRKKVEVSES